MEIKKEEVEKQLGYRVTDNEFNYALQQAKRKQKRIYALEKRAVTKERCYLVTLTCEYVMDMAIMRQGMDLCRMYWDMEKEHLFNKQGAPTNNHILTDSVL